MKPPTCEYYLEFDDCALCELNLKPCKSNNPKCQFNPNFSTGKPGVKKFHKSTFGTSSEI